MRTNAGASDKITGETKVQVESGVGTVEEVSGRVCWGRVQGPSTTRRGLGGG